MRRQVAHEGEQCLQKCGRGGMTNLCACNGNGQQRSGTTIFLSCLRWQHKRNVLDMPFVPTGHVNACSVLSGKISVDAEHTHMHTHKYIHTWSSLCIYMCIYFNGLSRGFEYIYYAGSCWTHVARITFALWLAYVPQNIHLRACSTVRIIDFKSPLRD